VNRNKESEQTQDSADGRGKPGKKRPWCWQEKQILRTIGDIFDASNDVASARSVYVAITEIASDEQSDTFTRPIAEIERRAGVSRRTVASMLNRFEELKIIRVKRNMIPGTRFQAPSTYTLCNHCLSLGNHCLPLGNSRLQPSLPRIRKNKEESQKNDDKPARAREVATSAAATTTTTSSSISDAEKHPYWKQFKRFCESGSGSPTVKGFNTWLKSQPPSPPTRKSSSQKGTKVPAAYAAALRASMEQADKEARDFSTAQAQSTEEQRKKDKEPRR